MEANSTVRITLTMNEKEAMWLKMAMQNPLHGETLKDEDSIDRDMRMKLWETLHEKV